MTGFYTRRLSALFGVLAVCATACGGGDETATDDIVLRAQGDIAVNADDVADTTTTATEGAPSGDDELADQTGSEEGAETTTTLPQEELTEGEALFEAIGIFQSCLAADGYEFLGIPDPSLGDVPQNAQPYIDALIACAARSQIQERLAAADAAQADLTPDEVEAQNRQYLAFRDCMIGRGWNIPDPVPNEFGLLFPGFTAAASWQGPPGEDITDTDDVGECTSEANIDLGDDQ